MQTTLLCLFVCVVYLQRSLGAVHDDRFRNVGTSSHYPFVRPGACYPQCQNGGTCIRTRCVCRPGYTGIKCEILVRVNQPSYQPPRPNYQLPRPTYQPHRPTYQPSRPTYQPPHPNYQPPHSNYQTPHPTYPLETKNLYPGDDTCHESCQNGGACMNTRCYCTWEWEGSRCDIPARIPNYPPPKPSRCNPTCRNGGLCINKKCVCPQEYRGPACEYLRPRALVPRDRICRPQCVNGGICINNKCLCPKEWKGTACEYSRTKCSYETLLNLGANGGLRCEERRQYGDTTVPYTCNLLCDGRFEYPPASKYTCDYATGRFTPTNIPTCIQDTPRACNPDCLNGGRCRDGGSGVGFYCECPRGWRGSYCERRTYY